MDLGNLGKTSKAIAGFALAVAIAAEVYLTSSGMLRETLRKFPSLFLFVAAGYAVGAAYEVMVASRKEDRRVHTWLAVGDNVVCTALILVALFETIAIPLCIVTFVVIDVLLILRVVTDITRPLERVG
jgi:hypothetical protein